MKFVTYMLDGEEMVGVVDATKGRVLSLWGLGYSYPDMLAFIAECTDAMLPEIADRAARSDGGAPLERVVLQAPIPHPRHDLICVGQNYVEHALEAARYAGREWVKPDLPVYFSKRVNRAVPPGGEIPSHADITSKLDYEAELAVVIGKRADHVREEDAYGHVFGYTVVNDVSARDLQSGHVQYTFGKGLDGFTPMGPWIATRDEFRTPPNLRVTSRVNGETRQDSNTSDFIFDIPRLISELSGGIVLEPGDVIITGTPSGVGMGFNPPRFLKSGDVVECEVEGIGALRNTVK